MAFSSLLIWNFDIFRRKFITSERINTFSNASINFRGDMWQYYPYKLNKNCAEIRYGCQNIAFSLGDHFLTHPVYIYIYIHSVPKKWNYFAHVHLCHFYSQLNYILHVFTRSYWKYALQISSNLLDWLLKYRDFIIDPQKQRVRGANSAC